MLSVVHQQQCWQRIDSLKHQLTRMSEQASTRKPVAEQHNAAKSKDQLDVTPEILALDRGSAS
jgi:hypothetical protein